MNNQSILLLTCNSQPIGVFKKLQYALQYIHEIIHSPFTKEFSLFSYSISVFFINQGFPSNIYKFITNNDKIAIVDKNDTRLPLSPEELKTFLRLKDDLQKKNPKPKVIVEKQITTIEAQVPINNQDKNIKAPAEQVTFEVNPKCLQQSDEQKAGLDPEEKRLLYKKIQELKRKKEKLEAFKNIFENDVKLYNIFKVEKGNNPDFDVPPLFTVKFQILSDLDISDSLNLDNYKIEIEKRKNDDSENFLPDPYFDRFLAQNNDDSDNESLSEDA
jgi:hypothetical protein